METAQKTCKEQIKERLKERLQDIKRILRANDSIEALNNIALCWDGFDLCLSTGAPADGFKFGVTNKKEIREIRYYLQDWFDGADEYLSSTEFDLLKRLYDKCLELE